jgi:alpha-ribazole phosphatase
MHITFIRHAETVGNLQHVWQGHGDSVLSDLGRRQAADLGRRPIVGEFDLVVGSDLGRVRETAALAGLEPEIDPAWREIDLGRWEGLTSVEIDERYPEELAAMRAGEDIALGGGESQTSFSRRLDAAVADLVGRCDPSDRVAVLTHGGVIQNLVAGHLGLRVRPRPWPIGRTPNTSLTTFSYDGSRSLRVLNDITHTEMSAPRPATAAHRAETGTIVALIRHGETQANLDGRWQGMTDGPLTEEGVRQARRLAAVHNGFDHVYSSGLRRARDTAAILAEAAGVEMTVRPDLHELDFGKWEDRTPEEVRAAEPDEFDAIYVHHLDRPRGHTGETAAAMGRRMAAAVAEIAARHPGGRVAAVSHGGAIRALAADLVGLSFDDRGHLAFAGNTTVTDLRVADDGLMLLSYSMQPWR